MHKEKIPIRPLVNYTTAPAYKLAKHMDHVIRTNITFQNHTAIKKSMELIQNIKEKHIPHNINQISIYVYYTYM